MLSQVLAANELLNAKVLATNKVNNVGGGDELSDGSKYVEPKTRRSES